MREGVIELCRAWQHAHGAGGLGVTRLLILLYNWRHQLAYLVVVAGQ